MRVTHVISGIDPRCGGPAIALHGLATAQCRADTNVRVITTHGQDSDLSLAEALRHEGAVVHTVGPVRRPLGRHPLLAPILDRVIADSDIVHIHGLWEQIQHDAARLAHARGVPFIIRPCGMLDPWSLQQRRWRKQLYLKLRLRRHLNRAAALHCTSDTEALVRQHLSLTPRTIIEPNGIELAEFERLPGAGVFRHRYQISPEQPLVLMLARLHPVKGLDLLLPALAQLVSSHHAAPMLALAGPVSADYRRHLEAQIERHQLHQHVCFTGMLHGRAKLEALVDADLFVLPSYHENFGIAVIEALAAGTPVVVSDRVNTHKRIVEAGVGEAIPPAVEPLTDALTRWLSNDALRRQAAARARPFVWERYDWRRIAERWDEHYRTLTATPTPASTTNPG